MAAPVEEKDLGYRKIKQELSKMDSSFVMVGFPDNGELKEGTPFTVASIATVLEYGSEKNNLPARPFMRQAFEKNQEKINKKISSLYNQITKGKMTTERALGLLGEWFVGRTKAEMKNGSFQALAPSTVKAKGSTKPLVDTGQLRNSVTQKVVMK